MTLVLPELNHRLSTVRPDIVVFKVKWEVAAAAV